MENKDSVAVIGCGISGLFSIKNLKNEMDVTAFESKTEIGGQW